MCDDIEKYLNNINEKKIKISITLRPEILELLNKATSNRSNYLDWVLLNYFDKNGIDIKKIKL